MTNEERYQKLTKAISLIREVEFSYAEGSSKRTLLYSFIVKNFSLTGELAGLIKNLKTSIVNEIDKKARCD